MTTSIVHELGVLRRGPHPRPKTLADDLAAELLVTSGHFIKADGITWPSSRYRTDPVAFFREILGVEPWSKQRELIELVRDNPRVAVGSGQKVSKSHSAAGLALWFYSSFEDARVVLSSTTARQIDDILWLELRKMVYRAGRCVDCKLADPDGRKIPRPCPHSALIDGELHDLARSGLKSPDFRQINGFTAREAEAVQGVSGKNLLYLVDEASGVPDPIFEAMEGNRAGGARIVLFGNPTKNEGEFFEAFHSKAAFYKTMHISSEDSPNVVAGREIISGLCTRSFIEEKKQEWGVESALYQVRIQGKFAMKEAGKVLSLHLLTEAESRWPDADESGRLFVGLDPAGEGTDGDESVFALRRGLKVLGLYPVRGMSEAALVQQLVGILTLHRKPREPVPIVLVDAEGAIGSRLLGLLRAYADENPEAFEVVGVKSSHWASREPQNYERVRDELWANLHSWLHRDGGAIPSDTKLAKELHAPEWVELANGKRKVTAKRDLKKLLGRSPDRADAVALSVWVPAVIRENANTGDIRKETEGSDRAPDGLDPYAGMSAWGPEPGKR